jgi:hypothetical protein
MEAAMSRRVLFSVAGLLLLAFAGWSYAGSSDSNTGAVFQPFQIVDAGGYAIFVETTTGKTWLLRGEDGWIPLKRPGHDGDQGEVAAEPARKTSALPPVNVGDFEPSGSAR